MDFASEIEAPQLSRDPRESSFWCYRYSSFENEYASFEQVRVREVHQYPCHTDYQSTANSDGQVIWEKHYKSKYILDEEWTPIHKEVFDEVKRQFLVNISLRRMKPFQETDTVRISANGKYLFYCPKPDL